MELIKEEKQVIGYTEVSETYGVHTWVKCIPHLQVVTYPNGHTELSPVYIGDKKYDREVFLERLSEIDGKKGKRFLQCLEVMLPRDVEDVKDFGKYIVDQLGFENIPWFYTTASAGEATYIYIYFTEREYYPEGMTYIKRANCDFYRNDKGQRARKGEGKLIWKKGDVLGEEFIYFSKSKREIIRLPMGSLIRLQRKIKESIGKYLSKKNLTREKKVLLPRLGSRKGGQNISARLKYIYNKRMYQLEQKLTFFAKALAQDGDSIHNHTKLLKWLRNLVISDGSLKVRNHTFKYFLRFNTAYTLKTALDCIEDRFVDALSSAYSY